MPQSEQIPAISLSSVDHQRALRIDKANQLRTLGQDPFSIVSKRDFQLLFLAFWFRFVHSLDFEELRRQIAPYSPEYLVYQALFPKDILEQANEMVRIRSIVKQVGLDPDSADFKDFNDIGKINEIRELFPDISRTSKEQRFELFNSFFSLNQQQKPVSALQKNQIMTIAGRVVSKRVSGKIGFLTLEDESYPAGFQVICKIDELVSKRHWQLNFRTTDQLTHLNHILTGTKTIEIRALNPDEPDRYFGDIVTGDTIELVDILHRRSYWMTAGVVRSFSDTGHAFASSLDFVKVFPQLASDHGLEHIISLIKSISPQYLEKIQQNGFVAIEILHKLPTLDFAQTKDLIDESDYIQVTGYTDFSLRGEPSLFATHLQILTKAIRPLPVSMPHDELEARYLNRVADLKLNTPDANGLGIRDLLRKKSRFWQIWREEMLAIDFLEVETPVFELIPGGAEANPFVTHYDAMDMDVYLRISTELSLKRMIAGGFEKVFEIGRIFRNEGASPQHLQEYTQIEFYWAYTDYVDVMRLTQRIYKRIVKMVLDGKVVQTDYYGKQIDWGEWCTPEVAQQHGWQVMGGWPLIPFFEAVRYFTDGKIDIENKTLPELHTIADENKIKYEPTDSVARLLDLIYKKTARQHIQNPIFLILPPVELEPLAKRDPTQPHLTQRFQIVAGTAEIGKGFSELNDPIEQSIRFESQQAARDAGDTEAQFMDTDYVEALEYGTPPMGGFGVSERFFSFLLGKNIKECVTFPFVKKGVDESGGHDLA